MGGLTRRRALDTPLALLLHGEIAASAGPDDQDSLVQVEAIGAALVRLGFRAERLAVGPDLEAAHGRLAALRPAVVVNLVESLDGSGRLIHLAPLLLEAQGLPFTGCGSAAMRATNDKLVAKRLLAGAGIPTPAWLGPEELEASEPPLSGRFIVKSVDEHASRGLGDDSVVGDRAALHAVAAARRAEHGGAWFAERYLDGREFNVALIEEDGLPRVLPIAEMTFVGYPAGRPRIVDYAAKWRPDSFAYRHTLRRFAAPGAEARLHGRLAAPALRCWRAFGLEGYARVDLRLEGRGRPSVLEVNANPCLAPDAGFTAAAAQAGLDLPAILLRLVAAAKRRRAAPARARPEARPSCRVPHPPGP